MRGSLWRKWDLHVHTPESYENSYDFFDENDKAVHNGNIWDKYIDELESIGDISVLGITDYFSVSGYKKVLKYREKGRLQNFDLILPNIEFRLDTFVHDNKRLNYHVIFSDELQPEYIERNFLDRLHFKDTMGTAIPLNEENIKRIGNLLKQQHSKFNALTDYFVGCMNITIDLDEIIEILTKNPHFKGKYILVAVSDLDELSRWDGQGHLTRKNYLTRSDAMFTSNPNNIQFLLGELYDDPNEFIKEFGSLKPCIHGSDAHSFNKLGKPDEDRYCWIKADTTFEGLKQILYEPADRVRISKEKPENRKNIYTIDQIKVSNSDINKDLTLKENDIGFNKNLVVVTGGKGSGKTALLDLIANCYEDRCKRSGEDKNSFVQRIENDKPDLNVELSFIGPSAENFSKKLYENRLFKSSKITYLPQGQIEDYSGDRIKLDYKIKEIIFNNKDVKEKGFQGEYDALKLQIKNIYHKIEEKSWKINELKKETTKEKIEKIKLQLKLKEGELKNKEEELISLSKSIDVDISDKINSLKAEESKLRIQHSKMWDLKEEISNLKDSVEDYAEERNFEISTLNENLIESDIQIEIPPIELQIHIETIDQASYAVDINLKELSSKIKSKEEELKKLSGVKESYIEIIDEVDVKNEDIKNLNDNLAQIKNNKKEIEKIEKAILIDYKLLLSTYFHQRSLYEDIITAFSGDTEDILNGIEFKSNIYFNKTEYIDFGLDLFDKRRKRNIKDEIEKMASILNSIIVNENIEGVQEFVEKSLKMEEYIREKRSITDLHKWIFTDYFSLSTEIKFNERNMEKLSMGQKGTVLLKLFLAEGDYPLIVDQPEDNLDNKFIYKELVHAFRDAKKKRQIIIATNNANLVVNTDAEQIIVAEFENNNICYNPGSIENPKTRDNIMPILEGGELAFREREKKYGI
jgi:energy-coupling factor transporter ATP-binding protein EcfA2